MKWLTSSLTRHGYWHWRDGGVSSGEAVEARRAWLLSEGGLVQETIAAPSQVRPLPAAFDLQRRRWQTYLDARPLDYFALECTALQLCLPGPPRLWLRESPTWSIALGLTTPALGRRLFSRRYRGPLPPSADLRALVEDLRRIRRIESCALGDVPVLISGELLLDALSHAIDQVVARTGELGRWVELTPPLPGELRGLVDQRQSFRFLPTEPAPPPANVWRALTYDADDCALICIRMGEREARRVRLGEPLYRYAGSLRFTGRAQSLCVKDVNYALPSAWLLGS